jgi:hypothetical protein
MPQTVRVVFCGSRTRRVLMQGVAGRDRRARLVPILAARSSWETVEEGRYTEAAPEARALISTF